MMPGKSALLLKRKLLAAALGAALVVGGGATAALAAAGNQQQAPRATQGQSPHSSSHAGSDTTPAPGTSQDSHQIEGTISSVDTRNVSFVVASEHSGSVTVVVTAKTAFDDVSGFADLTVGMFVEVNGNFQTDNRLTATRIERGDDARDDVTGDDRSGDDHRGGRSGGSGGSGRGGHDDGVPHS